jgi:CRP-like cAMP-binding protein
VTPEHPLLPKLRQVLELSPEEVAAVERVPFRRERVAADEPILREGARPTRSFALEEGLACSSKIVSDGGRQIIALHIPGDLPDLTSLHLRQRDCDLWALVDCELAFHDHRDLQQLCAAQPRLNTALWRVSLVESSVFREWVVNVGQRESIKRLAHLFCEIAVRMQGAGRVTGGSCAFAATQDDLAEATAMSPVHVNRVLQELRRRGLLSFAKGRLTVHNWDGLAGLADFRDDYLHLDLRSERTA